MDDAFLNHITLNTGHMRKTYTSEVDKQMYFAMRRLFKDAIGPEGAALFKIYRAKTTHVGPTAVTTVYGPEGAPILTTACSKDDDGSLWRMMHETFSGPLATKATSPAPLPYVVDRIEVGASIHLDALKWTGDFSRCFAWAALFPEKIR
ncbi:hypothetical protein J41TS12_41460 [Paenibacillus antibioticophila]|uniref:Uncharacterized protein n=1 Tax=Paenibacillus antibioticophila TaxID=1274374 RepID=A0A919XYN3_9BACL|nr:hypothetical protein [Paenibacillus antibioticophila]GIO39285.1 hypothetical protein J41TS12_41460 [Paenibacillus antibioticophila]